MKMYSLCIYYNIKYAFFVLQLPGPARWRHRVYTATFVFSFLSWSDFWFCRAAVSNPYGPPAPYVVPTGPWTLVEGLSQGLAVCGSLEYVYLVKIINYNTIVNAIAQSYWKWIEKKKKWMKSLIKYFNYSVYIYIIGIISYRRSIILLVPTYSI